MTAEMPEAPVLTRPLAVSDIPPDGRTVIVDATEAERIELARELDIPAVHRLAAEIEVKPWSRHGWRMTGRVRAAVTQTCVVTLEPLEAEVDEAIDVKFVPEAEAERYRPKPDAAGEVDLGAEPEDPPDVFDGATLDPGRVAEEHFMLGLDPYPRKPGASFDPVRFGLAGDGPGGGTVSPFAALSKLKGD